MADWAKIISLVIMHTTVWRRAEDALEAIASSLIETDCPTRAWLPFKALPLSGIVDKRCNIILPRLDRKRIHGWRITFISIFVGKPREGMTELVDDNRPKSWAMGRSYCIEIQDAAASVSSRISENDDMLVGDARKRIVQSTDI